MATIGVIVNNKQYTDGFKAEAIKQVLDRGFKVNEVAARLVLPKHTLFEGVSRARTLRNQFTCPMKVQDK